MAFKVSTEQLKSFHRIDRVFYTVLIVQLHRDPVQALNVMALWLWLEEVGYPSIILTLRHLPDNVVNSVFDEAVTILNCLQSPIPPSTLATLKEIPRTYIIFEEEITLDFLHDHREFALHAIDQIVSEVCAEALGDILQEAIDAMGRIGLNDDGAGYGAGDPFLRPTRVNGSIDMQQESSSRGKLKMPAIPFIPYGHFPGFYPLFHFPSFGPSSFREQQRFNVPTPMLVPNIGLQDGGMVPQHFEVGESSNNQAAALNPLAEHWVPEENVHPRERALFITFSRGYPVSEEELRIFFLRSYGDVVEDIRMQQTDPNVQQLYAIVTLRSANTVESILSGRDRIKYVIRGKHVVARRYVPKSSKPGTGNKL
ncbi:Rho guanine nucleotide exchange factor [Thalictrum thalictroides]|uniref:Rho guanine nucleotide exchange factor n=1 Tax=Thalictrum thalictroides TaxID=46969 RepID=A0A7J6WJ32_THATH|nr:Rho guanine nucleotide exchange factor [Thalictrum thalictroides]